ncbi:transglutaminase-like domain-containing protein [Phreatobacter cathodiphilus]|uniref:Transglutaminase n=1 Tax=Phreatobacter cathodiphilus TaxID=1868589 RepID=A0A2S0NH07_9HYPH|nr:transglutaminase family protein [Phreatobacter cathodiphilus]AVO47193.1 transglutaminase [Phreatobacter cathodiphilus]
MHIRYGFDIEITCDQALPSILLLDVHPDRRTDISQPDTMAVTSLADGAPCPTDVYVDSFGNLCRRVTLPPGGARIAAEGVIHDSGFPDATPEEAGLPPPDALPADTLGFLLGSRYCETDQLMGVAWPMFGHLPPGGAQVQAICDFVHSRIRFDYAAARPTRTALEAYGEQVGVCRDFAHLAITLCRCMNIPARYCTGYLGDIGVPADPQPMDFSAWFEVFIGDRWYAFDARHNRPRIGRIVIARGRDATDVPFFHSFGAHILSRFSVVTEEVGGERFPQTAENRRDHWQSIARIRGAG